MLNPLHGNDDTDCSLPVKLLFDYYALMLPLSRLMCVKRLKYKGMVSTGEDRIEVECQRRVEQVAATTINQQFNILNNRKILSP